MCTSLFKPKVPKTPTPAAAPPPPEESPTAPVLNEGDARSAAESRLSSARRKGRNALRIDLQVGGAGAGGTGLNIPRA